MTPRIYKFSFLLAPLFILSGCERAVQTWVYVPDVRRETASECYETKGITLVPWANEIMSERRLKPLFKAKELTKAQQKELIYSRIDKKEEVADQDPMNARHIGITTIGLQNPISLPVTSIIATTQLSDLRREYHACLWKVTKESAWQNFLQQQEKMPLKEMHIAEMDSERKIIAKPPDADSIFNEKHPETYLPQ